MFSALKNLVGSSDAAFPFVPTPDEESVKLGESSIWSFNTGKAKTDGSPVSILTLDISSSSNDQVEAGRNACKRMKTLRHPNFVRFIESAVTADKIQIATEPVIPLKQYLDETQNPLAISWGIHQIAKAIDFLVDCKMMHKNLCISSIFVDPAGEWKLGGLEILRGESDDAAAVPALPTPQKYLPPEKPGTLSRGHVWSLDMWGFGCLIWEVFNGELPRPERLKDVGNIPKPLLPPFVKLIGANPKSRPSAKTFITEARATGKYLDNDFVNAMMFMEEVAIKSKEETALFYSKLPDMLEGFPRDACTKKFLPQLLQAFNYGGAGSAILAPLFKIGRMLPADEYTKQILPCVIKLFSSTDRATRINLLKQLHHFSDHLSSDVVSSEIFPHVATGFSDSVPAMREATVKSMLLLTPKLSEAIIDSQLLRHFAKMQMDDQPEIRTNTTICLGKISPYLSPATRQRVLITAFARSLKDPFNHARVAGLMAFTATHKYFSTVDVAGKIFQTVVPLTLDQDGGVKKQALSLCKALLARLENGPHEAETSTKATSDGDGSRFTTGWSWASSAFSAVTSTVSAVSNKSSSSSTSNSAADNTESNSGHGEEAEEDDDDDDDDAFEDATDKLRSTRKKAAPLKLGGRLKGKSSDTSSNPRGSTKAGSRLKLAVAVNHDDDEDDTNSGNGWGSGADSDGSADWGGGDSEAKGNSPQSALSSRDSAVSNGWGDDDWNDKDQPKSASKTADERKAAREARKAARLASKPEKKGMSLRGKKLGGLGAVKKD